MANDTLELIEAIEFGIVNLTEIIAIFVDECIEFADLARALDTPQDLTAS